MDQPVIRGAWYSPRRGSLDIVLGDGRHYRYWAVPPDLAGRFAAAGAKLRFFNREIRGRFACTPLGIALPTAA